MKFGQVNNPQDIDFSLPPTPPETLEVLTKGDSSKPFEVYVGCAKWNKTDLKGFYPRGTKDELAYYSTQFNSIELNATFYNSPSKEQVETWKEKTPADFKFFPKIPQSISHYSRLLNTGEKVTAFTDAVALFEEKLGMVFLQMIDNFKPKDFQRLEDFVREFPKGIPLAVEVRNAEWFSDPEVREKLYKTLQQYHVSNVLVDTAGRRDMLHMRMTTPTAFIRYVGANHSSDYSRLDEWIEVIKKWREAGLEKLYFFIHQNIEVESPLLANHFIKKLNDTFGLDIRSPRKNELF
ncbi:hypothetical protein HMPREF0765_4460 [Sphingobacterium spiritivorum ATCC 33300]|uniref:DUF72 domain-containing protein n=1 Tax=Sphingobacterium spiritivorum ATCC 33300 TaxID=525372 RepID=C2G4F4_SPHSI|nr:DUF72 domain-containing protein [Sphingobacterium spiritivorum]EEI89955.1 hypothetical protein HMPREF0765_4460 [Sphingobacterium spiritivorum ATCC 33300]QQS94892.1 DUF72 domain-containing protein [Sphingobacterium spiritivorum]